jgi:hypothetical protein
VANNAALNFKLEDRSQKGHRSGGLSVALSPKNGIFLKRQGMA